MAELKLTPAQYQLLKNDPLHYSCNGAIFNEKECTYTVDCDSATAMKIKKIVDN